jgi:hypothetical protein
MKTKILRCIFAFLALAAISVPAHAQLFRTYLSSTGSDSNPCTRPSPCRLLPAALAATADNGEVWMLDSANYNTAEVWITRSVTVLAIPGVIGSLVATGHTTGTTGNAIVVNGDQITVTLRNLVITSLGTSYDGIEFGFGKQLTIEDCEISNVGNDGLSVFAPNGKVAVKNTTIRNVGNNAFYAEGIIEVALDQVTAVGATNGAGTYVLTPAKMSVTDSVLTGNYYGSVAYAQGGTTRLTIQRSVITDNFYGIYGNTIGSGDVVTITASDNFISHSTSTGIVAQAGASSSLTIVADNNVIMEGGAGFYLFGAGTPLIYTRGNNTLQFNAPDVSGGSLTPFSPM